MGAGFELLSRTLSATSCPYFLVQLWLVFSMSFYLAPPLPTHYLVHFTRSGVLTMTIVLMLPTTFRLEVLQLSLPHPHLHHMRQWLYISACFLQLETTCGVFVDVLTHLALLEEPTTKCLGGWGSSESKAQGQASVLSKLLGDR